MATQQISKQVREDPGRAIGPAGTIARLATGLWLVSAAGWAAQRGDLGWYEAFLGFVGFPVIVMLIVMASQRVLGTSSYLRATGPIGTAINLGIIAVLFLVPYTSDIALIFYGVPMFLAAWRGYPGCEVLAISNFVLQRRDELGCPWFWPIDAAETRLSRLERQDC